MKGLIQVQNRQEKENPLIKACCAALNGRDIRVGYVLMYPSVNSHYPHTGVDISALQMIAGKLNFSYELVDAFHFGQMLRNGTFTGMPGSVRKLLKEFQPQLKKLLNKSRDLLS